MKKKFTIIMAIIILVFNNTAINTFAHVNSQASIIGWGACIGWDIKDAAGHTNGNTLYFKFDSADQSLTDAYKNYARQGAQKWSGTMNIIESDELSIGLVSTYLDNNTSTSAFFQCYNKDNNNHLTSYVIKMNRSSNQMGGFSAAKNNSILAHEFGHAIGLIDLEDNIPRQNAINPHRLMFWSNSGWTDVNPTDSDIYGACVITGQHSTHAFENPNHIKYDTTYHTNSCNQCNGIQRNPDGSLSLEPHNMLPATCTSPSRCTSCTYTQGNPTGHSWLPATCDLPERCGTCGTTKPGSSPLGHNMAPANCYYPERCIRSGCNYTVGSSLDHDWSSWEVTTEPTCMLEGSQYRYCTRAGCGGSETESIPQLQHTPGSVSNPCTDDVHCSNCGILLETALGHNFQGGDCVTPSVCSACGAQGSVTGSHDWQPATCEAPETCSRCSATQGSPLGHNWTAVTYYTGKDASTCPDTYNWEDDQCTTCGVWAGNDRVYYSYSGHDWSAVCYEIQYGWPWDIYIYDNQCTTCGTMEGNPWEEWVWVAD